MSKGAITHLQIMRGMGCARISVQQMDLTTHA